MALRPSPRSDTRIAAALALALASALAAPSAAAQRDVERRDFDEGQGKLIGFYSSALVFTPTGAPSAARPGSVRAAIELAYIPRLSLEERRVGDKPEATNLAPLFPRPRVALGLPGGLALEASWIPPVRFFDVRANVLSAALSTTLRAPASLTVTPRVAVVRGRVEGAITCYDDLGEGSSDLQEYYGVICNGRESDDHFEPRHLMGEVVVARAVPGAAVTPYAGVGVRADRTRFDIGVLTADGARDEDDPILELRATRAHLLAGADWRVAPRLRAAGELFWAPGSVLTVRLHGSLDVVR